MKYALIIGSNKYDDPKLAQLKTPAADSQALAKVLGDARIGAFDEVTPLVNQNESQVRRSISSFLINKKPDDLVMLYFSGHGVLDDRGRLYLALRDTQVNLLKATSIPSSFLADEMDSCRSKRQILVLDCCHSGAFERGTKGDQKAITETTFEGSGFGRVVLTASDSTQYALEGDQVIKQTELSLFTHFLLEGLKTGEADTNNDGLISLDEWYDYTYTKVISETPRQVPHKWSYNQQGDLVIAKNPFLKKRVIALPNELLQALDSSFVGIRESAVNELGKYLQSRDAEMAQLAKSSLEKMKADDSRRISLSAEKLLTNFAQAQAPSLKVGPSLSQTVIDSDTEAASGFESAAISSSAVNVERESVPESQPAPPVVQRSNVVVGQLAQSSWVKWAGTAILGIAACLAVFYYYRMVSDSPDALRMLFAIATCLTGLVQWGLFRNRLEFWWVLVNTVAGVGLGTVHNYLIENTGWGMADLLRLMAIWIVINFILGPVLIRDVRGTSGNTSPIVESGARQNLFIMLLSISMVFAAIINILLALEYYDTIRTYWTLYGISAILVSISFLLKDVVPRNFGFITLAIFLLFDGINVVRLAFNSDYPLYYFSLNAIPALASGIFFASQRETRKNLGFILLSGALIATGASNLILYDTAADRVLYTLAALCAVPAAVFFLLRKEHKA